MVNDESKVPRATTPEAHLGTRQWRTLPVIAKSVFATLLLASAIAAATYTLSHGIVQQGDEVSQSDAQARLEAFRSLEPLNLSLVAAGDVDRALQSMQLSQATAASLKAELSDSTPSVQAQSTLQNPSAVNPQEPQPTPGQAQAQRRRVQLVWITLWDTDVEDGDVVRIDSQGYSRTIRLTKKGDTFAVPVPADGVIKVTGVKDGDGGGITVGLASGNAKAVFPIMSEGQELGLKVRID